jgi:hypothetical protein
LRPQASFLGFPERTLGLWRQTLRRGWCGAIPVLAHRETPQGVYAECTPLGDAAPCSSLRGADERPSEGAALRAAGQGAPRKLAGRRRDLALNPATHHIIASLTGRRLGSCVELPSPPNIAR